MTQDQQTPPNTAEASPSSNGFVRPGYSQGIWGNDPCILSDGMPLTIDEVVGVLNTQEELINEETQKSDKLKAALKELMKYTPRKRWKGGVESGKYVDTGEALLKVLDRCDEALSEA